MARRHSYFQFKLGGDVALQVLVCHELGDKRGTEVLKFGMREFDRNESKQGRKAICADLLKSFPEYIRK